MYVCMYARMVITFSKARAKSTGYKVANPARGQLNREKNVFFPVPICA